MRTGPLGRREAHISRVVEGLPCGFSRPAVFAAPSRASDSRRCAELRNPPSNASPLSLKCPLPINLREFLAEQFNGGLRIDDDGVFTVAPGAGEEMLSRVARAIRRFSTERAHEQWAECSVAIARLADELECAAEPGAAVVLCLGCAVVDSGAEAPGRHRGGGCVAVELGARTACYAHESEAPHGLTETLLHVIEAFRLGCAALGLPHYDLDCYVARGQVIFTWRPLHA